MKVLPVHLISRVSPPASHATRRSVAHRTQGHTHGVVNRGTRLRRWRRRPPRTDQGARFGADKKPYSPPKRAGGQRWGASRAGGQRGRVPRARGPQRLGAAGRRVHPRGNSEPGPRPKVVLPDDPGFDRAGRPRRRREADRGDGATVTSISGVRPAGRRTPSPSRRGRQRRRAERDVRGERAAPRRWSPPADAADAGYEQQLSSSSNRRAAPGPHPSICRLFRHRQRAHRVHRRHLSHHSR